MKSNKIINKKYFSKDYFFKGKNSNYTNYNLYDNAGFWKSLIQFIEKYKMSGKVLDIGCAFGFFLKRLNTFFDGLYGVDISEFAVQNAKEQLPNADFRVVDLNTDDLPYPNDYFDLITALDVLEHTNSISESLSKILPKLKKDGFLIISIPLNDTWAGRIFQIFDRDESHISIPSRKKLFKIIDDLGLKTIESFYFFNFIKFKLKCFPTTIEMVLQKK
ncbi:MAG: class I SAM-dependent methyltransferase [Spirochaetes bacterium]|nr:class I SAM-dependent methyltransferase [Spirochaetota bacterium]